MACTVVSTPSTTPSTWISKVDLGCWEYYIFSDSGDIASAINGVAAWMNGTGSGIIQGAGLFGGLVLLMMALYGAATHASKINAPMIGIWAFFMTTSSMTGTAQITNVYSGAVTTIAKVPALALVPASIFSKAAYNVFTSTETAFQGTSGSYMSVSKWGFVGPLDVLLTLRSNDAPALIDPALYQTLRQTLTDCGTGNSGETPAPTTTLESSIDALAYLKDYGTKSGLTLKFTKDIPNGVSVSCEEAFIYLNTSFNSIADGTWTGNPLLKLNALSQKPMPGTAYGNWPHSAVGDAFGALVAGSIASSQTATQYTKNALVASYVKYSQACMGSDNSITSPTDCANGALAVAEGVEKWKVGAAASANGFLKTMFTSMGFLQVFFFALFPFIAVYSAAIGFRTAKVFGGYIFFGIWTQSWMLIVAPLQAYIQTSVIQEVGKITQSKGMSIANADSLYVMLSTKLALAGDMMASTQAISLALMSGSMVALSSVAQNWSARSNMNTNSLQRDLMKEAPMISERPIMTVAQHGRQGQFAVQSTEGSSTLGLGNSLVATHGRSSGVGSTTSDRTALAASLSADVQRKTGVKIGTTEAAEVADRTSSATAFTAQVGTGAIKELTGMLKGSFGKMLPASVVGQLDNISKTAMQSAFTQVSAQDPTFIGKFLAGDQGAISKVSQVATNLAIEGVSAVSGIAVGALISAGTGGVGTPAGIAAGIATRTGIKARISSFFGNAVKQGAKNGAADLTARAIVGMAKGGATFADALVGGQGGLQAVAKKAFEHSLSDTASWKAAKDKEQTVGGGASLSRKLEDSNSFELARQYGETASTSNTRTITVGDDVPSIFENARNMDAQMRGAFRQSRIEQEVNLRQTNPERLEGLLEAERKILGNFEVHSNARGQDQSALQAAKDIVFHKLSGAPVNLTPTLAPSGSGVNFNPLTNDRDLSTARADINVGDLTKPELNRGLANTVPISSADANQVNRAYNPTRQVADGQGNALLRSQPNATGMVKKEFANQTGAVKAGMDFDKKVIGAAAVTAAVANVLGGLLPQGGGAKTTTTGGTAGNQGQGSGTQPGTQPGGNQGQGGGTQTNNQPGGNQGQGGGTQPGTQPGGNQGQTTSGNNRAGAKSRERLSGARSSRRR